jgi:hypothetical protein
MCALSGGGYGDTVGHTDSKGLNGVTIFGLPDSEAFVVQSVLHLYNALVALRTTAGFLRTLPPSRALRLVALFEQVDHRRTLVRSLPGRT